MGREDGTFVIDVGKSVGRTGCRPDVIPQPDDVCVGTRCHIGMGRQITSERGIMSEQSIVFFIASTQLIYVTPTPAPTVISCVHHFAN